MELKYQENLKKRILITIGLVIVYLFGTYVVIPGIDPKHLTGLAQQTNGGLMALLDMFSGGAFSNASIFALGIIPYIYANIIMMLIVAVVPYLRKMQHEGENGRRKINQMTSYLTVAILIILGFAYLTNLQFQMVQIGAPLSSGLWSMVLSISTMTAGSMFVLWISERITDNGIGNGILFILIFGIINRLPQSIAAEFTSRINGLGGLVMFLMEMLFLLLTIAGAILLVQAIEYFKRKGIDWWGTIKT